MKTIQKLLTIKIQNYKAGDVVKCPCCFNDCMFVDDGYNWLINHCYSDNCNNEFSIEYHIGRTLFISIDEFAILVSLKKNNFEIDQYKIYADYSSIVLLDLDNSYSSVIINNPEKIVDLLIFI